MTQLICALFLLPALGAASAHALTVEEIIRLKKSGVADSTIELLIEKNAEENRRAGVIRRDGWIVHTTDTREPQPVWIDDYSYGSTYPTAVYPWVRGERREFERGVQRPVPLPKPMPLLRGR
jgi:hypothetical protein